MPNIDYSGNNITIESAGWNSLGFNVTLCLCAGSQVQTANGTRRVQDLAVGDLVLTADHGLQPIRWIGHRKIQQPELAQSDKLRPVRIMAGSLGQNMPEQDLLVSRQHRMLATSPIVKRMFDVDEVLIPAIHLTALPGVYVDHGETEVDYFHILFDQHEVIYANGAPTESFYTGPEALRTLPPDSIAEIAALLPNAIAAGQKASLARLTPKGKQTKQMVARHMLNGKTIHTSVS